MRAEYRFQKLATIHVLFKFVYYVWTNSMRLLGDHFFTH